MKKWRTTLVVVSDCDPSLISFGRGIEVAAEGIGHTFTTLEKVEEFEVPDADDDDE